MEIKRVGLRVGLELPLKPTVCPWESLCLSLPTYKARLPRPATCCVTVGGEKKGELRYNKYEVCKVY